MPAFPPPRAVDLVERFFANSMGGVIHAGNFAEGRELVCGIQVYLVARNTAPTRHVWKVRDADMLEGVRHARAALATIQAP
jgi:hypothetical protein